MNKIPQYDLKYWIRTFEELSEEEMAFAGGKGKTLARLRQAGYPVPDGFIILPQAFSGDRLRPEAWEQVETSLRKMCAVDDTISFAVRSSALAEDSPQASFAGEFETVLDVHTREIHAAIHSVRASHKSVRVKAYSAARGVDTVHDLAVVIQRLVRADISGVLFTADPVTGGYANMVGNFVYGFGEDLVSGEADPYSFVFSRPKGVYEGPPDLKRLSRKLYKLANRLEEYLGCPQDIEWAVKDGKLYLLQSRPITTLIGHDPATGEWNDSFTGDYLWSNCNLTEAVPDVMTPLTSSMWQIFHKETAFFKSNHPHVGNICGRPYANVSFAVSMLAALGKDRRTVLKEFEGTMGQIPVEMEVPIIPISKISILAYFVPAILKRRKIGNKIIKGIPGYIRSTPEWCSKLKQKIQDAKDAADLVSIWREELSPYFLRTCWMLRVSAKLAIDLTTKVLHELSEQIGETDANALLLYMEGEGDSKGGSGILASLAPLINVTKVGRGEMSRTEYLAQFGHRGPKECELSAPQPSESPEWLDLLLSQYKTSEVGLDELLDERRVKYEAAWQRFLEHAPGKVRKMCRKLSEAALLGRRREAVRSEVVRVFGVIRAFALRVGEITGLGDGVFFIYRDEMLDLLSGDHSAAGYIQARRSTYEKLSAFPPYPGLIRGRFDPILWMQDPGRRSDIFDSQAPAAVPETDTITGFAGSAGRIQGVVRRLENFEECDQFQKGEILVASTTNVGWTPLFPLAAAIITDIGAPLSHAAIVARELGIPAVVGCGNAMMRLKTGDQVIVDGAQGAVRII